jgi:DNA-binding MarR family transcriptional regulator
MSVGSSGGKRTSPSEGGVCAVCGCPLRPGGAGRPSRYCSAACRQRAYRARRRNVDAPPEGPDVAGGERGVPHLTERELLAWRGMLKVQSRLLPVLDGELRGRAEININEFDVLYQLWLAPGRRCRMKDLAQAVLVTPSGITRLVDRLAERGLVGRANSEGRQAVEAVLTGEGERVLRRAMEVHFAGVRRLFVAHLSAEEIDGLARLWGRLSGTVAP